MKNIILSLLTISVVSFNSYSTENSRNTSSVETITFYDIPLVCTAAPEIGCGTRSKPVLLEMEKDLAIKEAWLNRAGTVYAIVWAGTDKTDEIAKPIFEKYSLDFKKLNAQEVEKISSTFRESGKWYRGADVDKLSIEEAGVIAKDAITFALNKKLLSEEEARTIKIDIQNYLKTELIKVRTAEELLDNELTKKFQENISGIAAKTVGKERADKISELYMQTKPLEKIGENFCCEKKSEKGDCCKKKQL